jgi:hypothetical protein
MAAAFMVSMPAPGPLPTPGPLMVIGDRTIVKENSPTALSSRAFLVFICKFKPSSVDYETIKNK